MRSIPELQESIATIRAAIGDIATLAEAQERDLSATEVEKFEALYAQLQAESKQLDVANRLRADLLARAAGPIAEALGGHAGDKWQRDSRGRGFALLSKNDKAAGIFKPQAEHEFGHYVVAKIFGANRTTPASVKAALTGSDNTLGGFLVPGQLSSEVIDLARAKSVLMQAGTRTALMDSDSLTIPKLEADATVATKAQNAAFTASDVTFGARQLHTHTAGALVKLSQELAEDAPALLAEQLNLFMASALASQVDAWGLAGSGSAQPLGILLRPAISSTGSVGAIDWLDVAAAATAIRNANHEPNACLLNTEIHGDLFNAETGNGTNAARGWLDAPPTLRNVQFWPTTNCPSAKLIIGDFTRYIMGIRTGARVEATTAAGEAFERHQVWVKITMRFDFVTLDDTAFHVLDGITT